ncbi:MAG: hypothetical protein GQ533_12820 [Methanosarcinaceae archaeon]|jgi:hypothetical protein|nr:hypothetical protein [Methanosarcinaceae archaeon]
MEIVREYQRREFCKDWGCPSQKKIDEAVDQVAADAVREQDCKSCMAHVFHKWLNGKDYRIVVVE